jgi:hypothetical protein
VLKLERKGKWLLLCEANAMTLPPHDSTGNYLQQEFWISFANSMVTLMLEPLIQSIKRT